MFKVVISGHQLKRQAIELIKYAIYTAMEITQLRTFQALKRFLVM